MAGSQLFIGSYRRQIEVITAAMTTTPGVVWKPGPNGSRVHSIVASSRSASAVTATLSFGQVLTKQDATNTGAMTLTATTITRTNGSFITDGWLQDMRVCLPEATTVANRKIATITAVAATTLTFAASTFTAEALPTGASLLNVMSANTLTISANAGNNTSTLAVNLLTNSLLPWVPNRPDANEVLGPNDWILLNLSAALTTPATVEVFAVGGDY